jgi:8-oxo-dGTP pyrophosphatase MutT (NUDIX family)
MQPAALRLRFLKPPAWEPEMLAEKRFTDRAPMQASVLVPIVMREQPTILLTERTMHLSTHSGQIAFPGGKVDDEDVDAFATALREAQEEIGLDPAFVQILGVLPQYVTGSAFVITPVVALLEPGFTLTPNAHEVADVFEVPLDFLMNPAHHRRHAFEWEGVKREWFSMPYQDHLTQRFIWGATAGMLRNFYRLLSA